VGAYGGKREIMERMSPVGPVYQAGTLSGIRWRWRLVCDPRHLAYSAAVSSAGRAHHVPGGRNTENGAAVRCAGLYDVIGSMFTLFFSAQPVHNLDDASACDIPLFRRYFAAMLQAGIYLSPSQFETVSSPRPYR